MNARPFAGFSIIELIVSVGIIGTSLVLVVGIFTFLIGGGQKANDLTSGTVAADGIMSQQIYQLLYATQQGNGAGQAFFATSYATPTLMSGGTYQLNNTTFFYKLYCEDVTFSTLQLYSIDIGGYTNLKRLDVVVWWDDSTAGGQSSAQALGINTSQTSMGTLQVHETRLLWPSSSY